MLFIKLKQRLNSTAFLAVASFLIICAAASGKENESLEILFIGNSYTGRHNLSKVVEAMAEAGNPGLEVNVSTVIYGGRRLVDHWRLGTANFVRSHKIGVSEIEKTVASLEKAVAENPKDNHAKSAIKRNQELLDNLDTWRKKWDIVVLQSYRDDLEGETSPYMQYAPKFAKLANDQGARVILYETTPATQNAQPLTEPPEGAFVMEKENSIATLANRIEAQVAPMALIGHRCQSERPDLTLRFVNDAHLNHTMAYLTAATLYAAMFDKSPEGLPVDSITDIRFFKGGDKSRDRDGNSITRVFSKKDRTDLQRIAWEGYSEFERMRRK
ncbi:MAG: hypothetical protein CMI17_03480 [Opitutaceae bacterium]|nr:hypothetical protein [Opitutaceae bacterium]